ncbi:hypothetical protein GPJ56_010964 [Histomonas meleagridis]|uniref:uncharacterized protein n=1 Tax=Histomonas meleagridis TaxID=135588 RepID=UPI00355944A2|nr:hypothetical protein GPJ56_010964 [Histomonas meleagridis]KAH0800741.1 hypothetical protein GO595_006494 [Histomonas meleagridis]
MWDFDFDQDDAFVPMSFATDSFGDSNIFDDSFDTPTFSNDINVPIQFPTTTYSTPKPVTKTVSRPPQQLDDGSDLINENNTLRQTAQNLRKRFTEASNANQTLRAQLEECRSRFKCAMFSGFNTHK